MGGSPMGSVVMSTPSPLRRAKTQTSLQPRIAACNLWSSGQFHPWSIHHQQKQQSSPARGPDLQRTMSSSSMKSTVGPVPQRPRLGSKSASTTDLKRPVSSTASKTSAPLFPDEILENLYISDLETARAVLSPNYRAPGRPHIRYILSVLDKEEDKPHVVEQDGTSPFIQKFIKVNDWFNVNLLQYLPETREFIRNSLKNNDGGVLVHCRKGVSRSGAVMIAYVMEALNLNSRDATRFVVERRPKVMPNIGFQRQLTMWEHLRYSLQDADGVDKISYAGWKEATSFRVC